MNRQKIIIYVSILLDVLGLGILVPAVSELMNFYNLPDYMITLGIVAYSLCSFLAAPLLGQLSDIYWRKRPLIFSIGINSFSWLILFVAHPLMYFLGRMVNGFTWWNVSILQAILADISSNDKERKINFWLMGAMFWLGFVVWPMLGSLLLTQMSVSAIFIFGFIFAILNLVLVTWKFKETNLHRSKRKLQINPFPILWKYITNKNLTRLIVSLILLGIANFTYQAIIPILSEHQFGISGKQIWFYLAGIGLVWMLNQIFLVPQFWIKRFTNRQLLHIITLGMLPWVVIMLLAPDWWMFMLAWMSIVPFGSLMQVGYNNEVVSKVPHTQVGEAVWMLWSVQSLVMFIWPLFGSFALAQNIPVFVFTLIFLAFSYVAIRRYLYVDQYDS